MTEGAATVETDEPAEAVATTAGTGLAGHHRGEAEVGADDGKGVVAAVAHTLESAGDHGQLRMNRKEEALDE
ncbi:hypothetical protein [Nonomuraea sp. NPDC003709]|uniref:hypothetical protein n=1 Tax=Nonomuraea sp. NPDC003709 TaxID=3154450 RepID=UPI0033ABBAC3